VNYLAHYFCEHPDERPYFVLGLILPDLLRDVQKRKMRFGEELLTASREGAHGPIGVDIAAGIQRHLDVDVDFHNSAFFKDGMHRVWQWLEEYEYETIPTRLPVFAHVLLELMMDRIIIRHVPEAMAQFYSMLEQVERPEVLQWFEALGVLERPAAAFARIQVFLDDRFLYRYPDNAMMLYALNVLNQKVGQPVISPADEQKLLETINRTDAYLDEQGLAIYDALRQHA
jgi:hypothetical protein